MAGEGARADDPGTADSRTLTGEYRWAHGPPGPLTAVFTPTGEEAWDVEFRFTYQDNPRVFAGYCSGNLVDGVIEGAVQDEKKRRTFTFSCTFEDGRCEGTHSEIGRRHTYPTGTLTLEPAASPGG